MTKILHLSTMLFFGFVGHLLLMSIPFVDAAEMTVAITREALPSYVFGDVESEGCNYSGGEIVVSHPMSIRPSNKQYSMGIYMLQSAQLTIDEINSYPRCGVSLAGQNYSLTLHTYGDESSKDHTERIAQHLVSDNQTHFLLAGYSSGLTNRLTPIANNHSKLCLTAGSGRDYVHAEKDYVFGVLPPSRLKFEVAIEALTRVHKAQSLAYLDGHETQSCVEAGPELAKKYGLEFKGGTTIPRGSPKERFEEYAHNMSIANPDILMVCLRSGYKEWRDAMRKIDWSPKALVSTNVFGSPEYENAYDNSDWEYTLGVTSWDRALPPIPDGATGWTPRDYDVYFEQASLVRPLYQHAAQSAAISVLVQALERVNLPLYNDNNQRVTDLVRQTIATQFFPTVYGNTSFDINGQSAAPSLLLQYDSNQTLHVLEPPGLRSTNFNMVYPMPTWAWRDCRHQSRCGRTQGAFCESDGTCACPPGWVSKGSRESAECEEPPPSATSGTNYALIVALPLALLLAAGALLWGHYHKHQSKKDSLWQVRLEELEFGDPPEVLGRGTFGMVLLADYRGTQVAVKRVIPPKTDDSNAKKKIVAMDASHEMTFSKMSTAKAPSRYHGVLGSLPGSVATNSEDDGMASGDGLKSGSGTLRNEAVLWRKMKQEFVSEMLHLSKLRHPCITTVMGAVTKGEPMLVMEYMDHGSLYGVLHNETMVLEGELLLPMLRDITQGMRFLHSSNPQVLHGDLKAQNVLVDSRFRCKVADFGLSQKKSLGGTGTPFWMAPELLRMESANTTATDVYSFGVILYEVYSRRDPYEGEDAKEVLKLVADKKIRKRLPTPQNMADQIKGLMADCLEHDPDSRPSFEELDVRMKRADAETVGTGQKKASAISLFDIFPRHIAEALQDGRTVEAEHKDCVTIFFSDIVGFTNISATLEPKKVAAMLDRLYTKFDALSQKHDIFKVETIGDAYMAVTNLVKDQNQDHAKRIAEFSADAIQAAKETQIDLDDPQKGNIIIRVGFHSGPVVADVVGSRNPRYCLFGDSVNTASRMESNSLAGRVHCSKEAADLLKIQNCKHTIKPRGIVKIKGKGEMETFWIEESSM